MDMDIMVCTRINQFCVWVFGTQHPVGPNILQSLGYLTRGTMEELRARLFWDNLPQPQNPPYSPCYSFCRGVLASLSYVSLVSRTSWFPRHQPQKPL